MLAHACIPLDEVLRYSQVMGDPQVCEGYNHQIERVLRALDKEPLAAAGFALALVGGSQIAANREPNIVARPLAGGLRARLRCAHCSLQFQKTVPKPSNDLS